MTTAYLERPLDRVWRDPESPRQRTNRPSLFVQKFDGEAVPVCKFRIQSSPLVHRWGDWFDVIRVHAKTIATEMIGLKGMRPSTDALLPHGAMSYHVLVSDPYLPVPALPDGRSRPDPARGRMTSVLDCKVPLINDPFPPRREFSALVQYVAVSSEEPSRVPFDVSMAAIRGGRNPRGLTAPAFTKSPSHGRFHYTMSMRETES